MSATLSTGLFSSYFGCTVLTGSGRTHPVEQVLSARPKPSTIQVLASSRRYCG